MPARFEIVSQGEELVSGATVDRNAGWIAGELGALGLEPGRFSVVGDDEDAIRGVLAEAAARVPLVVCTGGLGPTTDDLTRQAAAAAFSMPLEMSAEALGQVEARYRDRGREMPPTNRVQGLVPAGARVLENHLGTAPGFAIDTGACLLYFLPGVPFEMEAMVREFVVPEARRRFELGRRVTRVLRLCGLAESAAAQRMAGFERPGVVVGYRASFPEVQVKLHVEGDLDGDALVAEARARLGDSVFGVDSGPLAAVVGEILARRGESVATAESCTAGRVAAELTAVAGASAYVVGGAVVYANAEKVRQCGVSPALLAEHGAVSEPVARALAEGIRERTGASWGVATSGIMGPGGGSAEKPVGTVHVAVAGAAGTSHRVVRVPYDRARNLAAATATALDCLRRRLLEEK